MVKGGRDTTTPALTSIRGCGAEETAGSSGVSWLIGGVSTVAWAAAVDA